MAKSTNLQSHIDEHLKPENQYIKSIYGEGLEGDGYLDPQLNLRLKDCKIGTLSAYKDNVIHFYKGSVDHLNITDGLVYLDGTKITKLTAENCRIRISDTIDGSKPEIIDLELTNCEIDVFNSEFKGSKMFKSAKECRINVYDSKVNCTSGGQIEGNSFNLVKCKIKFSTSGWKLSNTHSQVTSSNLDNSGSIPLYEMNNSYIQAENTEFKSIEILFLTTSSSLSFSNSKLLGGCRGVEIKTSGNLHIEDCIFDSKVCVKLTGKDSSCTWYKGSGKAKEIGVDLEDGASATLKDITSLECGTIGISAKTKSYVFADNVKNIKGGNSACSASGYSSMELLNCSVNAPVAFQGSEGTFVVRGDATSISGGTTAQGSGTFVIEDADNTYF